MPGPRHPWDEEDPRESTVDLPRIEHARAAMSAAPAPQGAVPSSSPSPPLTPSTAAQSQDDAADLPSAGLHSADRAPTGLQPIDRQLAAETSPARRPPAGSLADLRSRLARLPDGHPSSPYDDVGTARPLPIRLRQLELGLPAPEREHSNPERVADFLPSAAPAKDDDRLSKPGTGAPAGTGSPITDLALPADLAPPAALAPPAPAPAPAPNGNGHGGAARRARPDWQDPYAVPPASNGHSRHDQPAGQADLELGTWSTGTSTAGANGGSRPHDVPARPDFAARSAVPAQPDIPAQRDVPAQPDIPAQRDVPAEPDIPAQPDVIAPSEPTAQHGTIAWPGASRPDDEVRDLTERVMAACKTAEGQNLFGGYGNSGLTPAMRRIAAQLPHGGLAPGSEVNSLKSEERFAAKLARLIARNPGRPAEDLAWAIYDAIRYAFVFDPPDYTDGTSLVHRKLKTRGFELEARRNRWENPEYKGIWTRWRDPAHGLAFEVQFHTTASWALVQRTHEAYMRITDPVTPPGERARLRARQVSAAVEAKLPPRCMEIGDFRADAR